jgi:hypothetical protein
MRVHVPKFPGRIDMHQWEWRLGWIKSFEGEPQHARRIFADRIQHDWIRKLAGDLSNDVDTLSFELFEMR